MIDAYRALLGRVWVWFEQAAVAGWFDDADRRRMAAVEEGTPADLFADGQMRPLVVGLFGGTGVGKSSLLNRLAGQPVAEVGLHRPTSRHVTLYVHKSVRLTDLPSDLPLDRVRIKRHGSDAYRQVLWLDAPDIDSVEPDNRACALAWLPHVDLVCYIVSPERYRDDAGWRVLLERGHKHGWMFVLNRWDEGDVRQRDDFRGLLRQAGFDHPLLLCTCCVASPTALPSPDEFEQIQAALRELRDANAVHELTRLGHRARLQELRVELEELQRRLGDGAAWSEIAEGFRERWPMLRSQLLQGAGWSMRTAAARVAARAGDPVGGLGRQVAKLSGRRAGREAAVGATFGDFSAFLATLWDDWSQAKLTSALDATEIAVGRKRIAVAPIRQRLAGVADRARDIVLRSVEDHLRAALAQPGSRLVRAVRLMTGFLIPALPLVALTVVAYLIIAGYYRAGTGRASYLGLDFAIHSVLVVAAAWGVPFLLDRVLRPSVAASALRGMQTGFGTGIDALGAALAEQIEQAAADARGLTEAGQALLKEVAATMIRPVDPRNPTLARTIGGSVPGTTGEIICPGRADTTLHARG